jgi:hypothetical protein
MDDHFWLRPSDGRGQLPLVEPIGDGNLHAHHLECLGLLGGANERYHLVSVLYQMRHQTLADCPSATCDKDSHGAYSLATQPP